MRVHLPQINQNPEQCALLVYGDSAVLLIIPKSLIIARSWGHMTQADQSPTR